MSLHRIVSRLTAGLADRSTLAECTYDAAANVNDHFDYSKVVVRKPWGYEYLVFENASVAVWILYLKAGASTSFHCHLEKTTALAVLGGTVVCTTAEGGHERAIGEVMMLGKGVFHQTRATSPEGAFVMEIESPVNKRDLVRHHDAYGRAGRGYEGTEHMTFNLANFNYISFNNQAAYYDVRRRVGGTTLRLVQAEQSGLLRTLLGGGESDLIGVLSGQLQTEAGVYGPGTMLVSTDLADTTTVDRGFVAMVLSTQDKRVRAADYLVSQLRSLGVTAFHLCPGTSNAHLVDAVAREPDARYLPQASDSGAAQAAVVYAKITGQTACCILSSGASGAQAMTAVGDAWTDSAPVLFLSAQSCVSSLGGGGAGRSRQTANKELPVDRMASSITKFSDRITAPNQLGSTLIHAVHTTRRGRPGPVWLDVPIDLLGMKIDEAEQAPSVVSPSVVPLDPGLEGQIAQAVNALLQARRPVVLLGHGVRLAAAHDDVLRLIDKLNIPVLLSRRGADLLEESHPLYYGRPGTYGQRSANFVIQNADLLLSIGSRLSLPLTGRNYPAFAKRAYKIVVDIDPAELLKPTISADLPIAADAGVFARMFAERLDSGEFRPDPAWLKQCRVWRTQYPPKGESPASSGGVDPYAAIEALSVVMKPADILLAEGGACYDYAMQTFRIKAGQRIVGSSGLESEGFAIPGAVGACLALRGKARVVCLCPAASLLMNLPELAQLLEHRLPVTVVVLSGAFDPRTRSMQASYFGGRIIEQSQPVEPARQAMEMMGRIYNVPALTLNSLESWQSALLSLVEVEGPALCCLRLPDGHEQAPRITHTVTEDGRWESCPLDDMFPPLSRDEMARNSL